MEDVVLVGGPRDGQRWTVDTRRHMIPVPVLEERPTIPPPGDKPLTYRQAYYERQVWHAADPREDFVLYAERGMTHADVFRKLLGGYQALRALGRDDDEETAGADAPAGPRDAVVP